MQVASFEALVECYKIEGAMKDTIFGEEEIHVETIGYEVKFVLTASTIHPPFTYHTMMSVDYGAWIGGHLPFPSLHCIEFS